MSIADNITTVRSRIAEAARRAGREPGGVELLIVTKYRSREEIDEAIRAGHRLFGENRVQEAQAKIPEFPPDLTWHMIGHIQTNKSKAVSELFAMAHSVDSVKLARALDKARRSAVSEGAEPFDILLEVNASGEASKFGFPPDTVPSALKEIASLGALRVRGLMTMAPYVSDPEEARPTFARLRELRDRLAAMEIDNAPLDHLSMGMTNDFEIAVEEGATMVRVGSAIFS